MKSVLSLLQTETHGQVTRIPRRQFHLNWHRSVRNEKVGFAESGQSSTHLGHNQARAFFGIGRYRRLVSLAGTRRLNSADCRARYAQRLPRIMLEVLGEWHNLSALVHLDAG